MKEKSLKERSIKESTVKESIHSWISALLMLALFALCLPGTARAQAASAAAPLEEGVPVELSSAAAILIDAGTGQVIFEKNADEERPVASVTKVMTILLTLEALDAGTISLSDTVTVSPNAAGMGGSQALLDANAPYKVEDLLKSTIIASANDSAVALAETISGAQEAFVERMNERAQELGLKNTHYVNCTGLPAPGQYTTARDVAQLSRELDKHPTYYNYSTIWMDTITHKGGRVTDLTNTNRLVRFYADCDGYKTGSTNEARYCISATAKRGDLRLIAVVLGAPAGQTRFDEARKMLEYGFANYQVVKPVLEGAKLNMDVAVKLGARDMVATAAGDTAQVLLRKGQEKKLSLEIALPEAVEAPVRAGDVIGEVKVLLDGTQVASVDAVAAETVEMPGLLDALLRILKGWRI